ncbi:hypothetical protein L3Q67_39425 [Saccharothrix sp. AJ9571]|nr:hypothetical protein L3Q67_39425 [Saccharothrix sp. AJ9571]
MNIATVDSARAPCCGQLTSTCSADTGAKGIASAQTIVVKAKPDNAAKSRRRRLGAGEVATAGAVSVITGIRSG